MWSNLQVCESHEAKLCGNESVKSTNAKITILIHFILFPTCIFYYFKQTCVPFVETTDVTSCQHHAYMTAFTLHSGVCLYRICLVHAVQRIGSGVFNTENKLTKRLARQNQEDQEYS